MSVAVDTRRLPAPWTSSLRSSNSGRRGAVAGVRERTPGERRLGRAIGLGFALVIAIALLLVWVRLHTVHTGYQLSAARHLVHKLEQEQRELELEIATLTSPRRLESLARERLGMGPPRPGQIVSVP
jgi:cell division protein FtsL